jgi:cyclopropane-fatty-acyl-phospholipid synthase
MHAILGRLRHGRVELHEEWPGGERLTFGPEDAELRAAVELRSPRFYPRLARGRSVALAEMYGEGVWKPDDLVVLCRIATREIGRADPWRRRLAPLIRPAQRLGRLRLLNTRRGARRNIAAHYDLGNEMFELFLDREAMVYSCAYFEHEGATLEEAQLAKLQRICRRLELRPDDHLLEIGTGWGGLAIHAAANYGCRVTTTTISREQREYAQARIRSAGLEDRVRVLDLDYRDVDGTYDKLVSVEMIEAVGWEYFETFFRRCSELIAPHGLFLLQAICIDDRAYEAEKSSRTFAKELIFPGGCLPSVELIHREIARRTDMRTIWSEDISSHYALTLRHWRERFLAAEEQLEALGYDGRFRRIWEAYLAFSEAGFREARLSDHQMLFAKPGWRGHVRLDGARRPVEVETAA